jgi:hypothetical protein
MLASWKVGIHMLDDGNDLNSTLDERMEHTANGAVSLFRYICRAHSIHNVRCFISTDVNGGFQEEVGKK